jgi:hypothetical protein
MAQLTADDLHALRTVYSMAKVHFCKCDHDNEMIIDPAYGAAVNRVHDLLTEHGTEVGVIVNGKWVVDAA